MASTASGEIFPKTSVCTMSKIAFALFMQSLGTGCFFDLFNSQTSQLNSQITDLHTLNKF